MRNCAYSNPSKRVINLLNAPLKLIECATKTSIHALDFVIQSLDYTVQGLDCIIQSLDLSFTGSSKSLSQNRATFFHYKGEKDLGNAGRIVIFARSIHHAFPVIPGKCQMGYHLKKSDRYAVQIISLRRRWYIIE
ncbi:MAG: hypothetical protein PUC85_00825 [bacterium]|nr:hypothetical protein [Parabacteroides sp.]MDD6078709.1 hypothetical protein [bacterium]